jgi:hypothetical protein
VDEGGLGTILCQTDQKGNNKVIAYASRQFLKHEKNSMPFQVEMAAIVWAMEHFDTYLKERTFTVYSDCKPLEGPSKRHEKTLSRLYEAILDGISTLGTKKALKCQQINVSRNVVEAIRISHEDLAENKTLILFVLQ